MAIKLKKEEITTLHPDGDLSTNIYPNIKVDNIEDNSITINKLDTAIQDNLNDIPGVAAQVETNTVDIETNTSDIIILQDNYTIIDGNVSKNTSDIETNKSNISINTRDINSLKVNDTLLASEISKNNRDIADLQTQVTKNTSDNETNTKDIKDLKTKVETNTSDITINKGDIVTINKHLMTLDNKVNLNINNIEVAEEEIAALQTRDNELGELINVNTTAIATNVSDINELQTQVTANTSDITDLKNGSATTPLYGNVLFHGAKGVYLNLNTNQLDNNTIDNTFYSTDPNIYHAKIGDMIILDNSSHLYRYVLTYSTDPNNVWINKISNLRGNHVFTEDCYFRVMLRKTTAISSDDYINLRYQLSDKPHVFFGIDNEYWDGTTLYNYVKYLDYTDFEENDNIEFKNMFLNTPYIFVDSYKSYLSKVFIGKPINSIIKFDRSLSMNNTYTYLDKYYSDMEFFIKNPKNVKWNYGYYNSVDFLANGYNPISYEYILNLINVGVKNFFLTAQMTHKNDDDTTVFAPINDIAPFLDIELDSYRISSHTFAELNSMSLKEYNGKKSTFLTLDKLKILMLVYDIDVTILVEGNIEINSSNIAMGLSSFENSHWRAIGDYYSITDDLFAVGVKKTVFSTYDISNLDEIINMGITQVFLPIYDIPLANTLSLNSKITNAFTYNSGNTISDLVDTPIINIPIIYNQAYSFNDLIYIEANLEEVL